MRAKSARPRSPLSSRRLATPDHARTRPPLSASLSATEFARWYRLKTELAAFCRAQRLPVAGSKQELAGRIVAYLAGRPAPRPSPARKRTGPMPRRFTPSSVIGADWRCNQALRAFFDAHVDQGSGSTPRSARSSPSAKAARSRRRTGTTKRASRRPRRRSPSSSSTTATCAPSTRRTRAPRAPRRWRRGGPNGVDRSTEPNPARAAPAQRARIQSLRGWCSNWPRSSASSSGAR